MAAISSTLLLAGALLASGRRTQGESDPPSWAAILNKEPQASADPSSWAALLKKEPQASADPPSWAALLNKEPQVKPKTQDDSKAVGGYAKTPTNLGYGLVPEHNLAACALRRQAPQRRPVKESPNSERIKKEMIYVLYHKPSRSGEGRYDFVEETPLRRTKCLSVFPHARGHYGTARVLTSSDKETFDRSMGVCLLTQMDHSMEEWPLEYSEYNTDRNIPNFVAYKVLRTQGPKYHSAECRARWRPVCPAAKRGTLLTRFQERCNKLVDFHFRPSELRTRPCQFDDGACSEKISSRGHMSPVTQNAWSLNLCSSTMQFINVFPSRQPFDGLQWASREALVSEYMKRFGHGAFVWAIVGVSRETDGHVDSLRLDARGDPLERVAVPSFVWTAIYDPQAQKATGWLCRNGLTPGDSCYCLDMLSIRDLESRVGHRIFPDLEESNVDLEDGAHDAFWSDLHRIQDNMRHYH